MFNIIPFSTFIGKLLCIYQYSIPSDQPQLKASCFCRTFSCLTCWCISVRSVGISKVLDVPRITLKAIIHKGEKLGTTVKWRWLFRQKLFLTKHIQAQLTVSKCGGTKKWTCTKVYRSYVEARWWQHHGLGLLFSAWAGKKGKATVVFTAKHVIAHYKIWYGLSFPWTTQIQVCAYVLKSRRSILVLYLYLFSPVYRNHSL